VAAATTTVVNSGKAAVYPTLRMRNTSATAIRLYQFLNTTTGAGIYFNYSVLGGETATLTLDPNIGNRGRTFQSDFQGNVFGRILPGSNLTAMNLLPGTNTLSFFSDSSALEVALYWVPRGWSSDSGTVF
jgi:hypothetical protein